MIELLKRLSLNLGFLHPRHSPRPFVDTDPRAARHWHNPADPVQAARIEAAAAKRGRRKRKLHNHVVDSVLPNRAHGAFLPDEDGEIRFSVVPRLNPFYIAK